MVSEYLKKLTRIFAADKKMKTVLIIGLVGILLIGASELFPRDTKQKRDTSYSYEEYVEQMEKKTRELVASIEGVGECRVMLTLSRSTESVYAKNSQENTDSGHDSRQNEYVLYEGDGGEEPLLLQENYPQVMGVAVVCSGANSAIVRENIIRCIAALYNIPTSKISVSKLRD